MDRHCRDKYINSGELCLVRHMNVQAAKFVCLLLNQTVSQWRSGSLLQHEAKLFVAKAAATFIYNRIQPVVTLARHAVIQTGQHFQSAD